MMIGEHAVRTLEGKKQTELEDFRSVSAGRRQKLRRRRGPTKRIWAAVSQLLNHVQNDTHPFGETPQWEKQSFHESGGANEGSLAIFPRSHLEGEDGAQPSAKRCWRWRLFDHRFEFPELGSEAANRGRESQPKRLLVGAARLSCASPSSTSSALDLVREPHRRAGVCHPERDGGGDHGDDQDHRELARSRLGWSEKRCALLQRAIRSAVWSGCGVSDRNELRLRRASRQD